MTELGIKPYRSVTPNNRYFNSGSYSVDTSGDEVVGTYASVGKDIDVLKSNMLNLIKSQLTSKLEATDLIQLLISNSKKIGIFPINSESWSDFGQLDELNKLF